MEAMIQEAVEEMDYLEPKEEATFKNIPGVRETLYILEKNDQGHTPGARKQLITQAARIFSNSFAFINCGLEAIQDLEAFLEFHEDILKENKWENVFADMFTYIDLVNLYNRTGQVDQKESKEQFSIDKIWTHFFRELHVIRVELCKPEYEPLLGRFPTQDGATHWEQIWTKVLKEENRRQNYMDRILDEDKQGFKNVSCYEELLMNY